MANRVDTIEIGLDGDVQITVKGIKGKACKDATRQVEEALGRTVSSTPTGEFYEREKSTALN